MLAELHLHFHGCVRPMVLLRHLAGSDDVNWEWYETEMVAAYGEVPPTRQVVERFRRGDPAAAAEFAELFVFGDKDAGNFSRFQAKSNLLWAAETANAVAQSPPGFVLIICGKALPTRSCAPARTWSLPPTVGRTAA